MNYLLKPIGFTFPEAFPIALIIWTLYVFVAGKKSWRIPIGEFVATNFFRGIGAAIGAGEFCLEHRWVSLFLIIGLMSLLTYGFVRETDLTRRNQILSNNFVHWAAEVETFVEQNTMTKVENEKYASIHNHWHPDFGKVLGLPSSYSHPAHCLIKLLDTVYLEKKDLLEVLRVKLPEINKTLHEYGPRPKSERTYDEARMWALINILMGRIYIRLSKGCTSCEELLLAKQYFDAIDTSQFNEPDTKRYNSDVSNGRGTVYANAMSAYLLNPKIDLKSICLDANQCATAAMEAYEIAGKSFEPCSFHGRRKINNTADLLVRMCKNYDRLPRPLPSSLNKDLRSAIGASERLKNGIGELMQCSRSDTFIPTVFVTAAQAFIMSAKLKDQAGEDSSNELDTAGLYLRLASNFEPESIADKDVMSYFCFAIRSGALDARFRKALVEEFPGLPSPDIETLTDTIKEACH